MSGINNLHELNLNHEFNEAETRFQEQTIGKMLQYIVNKENPFAITASTDSSLYNILTQQIMSAEIRNDLLSIFSQGKDRYLSFRRERFIEKTKAILSTITRANIKTFVNIDDSIKSTQQKHNVLHKELLQAQKFIDIARLRQYDMTELFKFDLISSNMLFDGEGFMRDPNKSTLVTELENNLTP